MRKPDDHRNILLLSNDEETTCLLTAALAEMADVTTTLAIEDLYRFLKSSAYDSFLCDWDFQGADWREICQEVQRSYPTLPIIVVSRSGGEQEWMEALQAGCFDLISPPFSTRYVLSIIEHAMASHDAEGLQKRGVMAGEIRSPAPLERIGTMDGERRVL